MFERAKAHRDSHTHGALNWDEFKNIIDNRAGLCKGYVVRQRQLVRRLSRMRQEHPQDVCHLHRSIFQMYVYTGGKPAKKMVYFGRAY